MCEFTMSREYQLGDLTLDHFAKKEWLPNEQESILMAKEIIAYRSALKTIQDKGGKEFTEGLREQRPSHREG
jgi:hypothetical protein